MTRTGGGRFPILVAVITAMAMLFSPVQAQEGSAPDQPTGLTGTASHDSVTLTWDDPDDDSITGYVVLRRVRVNDTGGDFDVLVANTETGALTYTDDTVSASTTYTYRIKAINQYGVSERSRWFHIETRAASHRKSAYVDAHNAGVHELAELSTDTDPLNPDAGDTEEEERKAGKQGKSVGTRQGRDNHTVSICDRTPEMEAALLDFIQDGDPSVTCSTVTADQLANVDYLYITDGYSSEEIVDSDFAGLTGLVELFISGSDRLTTVPANAFQELRGLANFQNLALVRSRIKTIHPDAFDGLDFVGQGTIDLAFNRIEILELGTFDSVTGLEILGLRHNHIKAFDDGFFENMTELEFLSIASNRIRANEDTFRGLTSLRNLNMRSNGISTLHSDTFDGLSALEQLYLGDNAISELPAGIFADLPVLGQLDVGSNDISSLDSDTFSGRSHLWDLNLYGNNLTTLPEDVFNGLQSLQYLNLYGNNLTTLPEDVFNGLQSLQRLYLYSNNLTTLPADVFEGLTGLQRLYLHGNNLTTLPADVFEGLTGLQQLYLYGNELTTLDEDIFDPLDDSLTQLLLFDNNFGSLPENVFDGLDSVQYLYLHRAGLTSLDPQTFDPLDNLLWLYLYGNDLTMLPENVFDGLSSLQRLYLYGNDLTTLPENVFDGLSSLQRLYLDGNELTSLPEDVFDGLSSLQDLNLDENSLSALEADLFDGLDDSLTDLYLRDNGLTALPAGVFDSLTGLERLDLSCNALTTLELEVFDPFAGTLRYLDVGANSLTTPPTEAAVNAKLMAVEALYLTGSPPCLPAFDTGLGALSLSSGTLTPPFAPPGIPGYSGYRADISSDVSELTITVATRDPHAEVEPTPPRSGIIYDDDLSTPGLQVRLDNRRTVRWQVLAENRAATQIYNVAVYREHPPSSVARLRSLELSGLTLLTEFGGTTYDYEAGGPASATQTSVTATPLDPDAEVAITVDGVSAEADGTVNISPDSKVVTVVVTAEDGVTTQTYTVDLVQRDCSPGTDTGCDASLKSLSLSDSLGDDIPLSPEFSAEVTSYTASVESSVSSTTVTAETTDEDATAVIMINGVEDADGTVDLVGGYNVITVVVTAQDGTTTQSYTVTVLRAQPDDDDDSTDDTITSLLSRLDAGLIVSSSTAAYISQAAGYRPPPSMNPYGDLSPAGFNYPAGFGPWYTVESLIFSQEGPPGDIAVGTLELEVRGAVTSVLGTDETEVHVLPANADITLHLEGEDFTWSASLEDAQFRGGTACVEDDGSTRRLCRIGEPNTEKYQWTSNLPPTLTGGEKVIVRLRYEAPRPGKPGRPLVTAPAGKSGALVVNWTAPANDDPEVRGYEVHVSPAPGETGASGVTKTTGGSTTRLPVLLLEPDTAYDVRVRARTYFASGPWSDTVRATTNPLVNSGTNTPSVTLDLDSVTKVKVGDRLYKRLRVTGMNNLHRNAFPDTFDGYDQSSFVEFRVLDSISDSYGYEDLTRGYGEGAFYAGALTIGEDGEVYHNFGYEVIATGPINEDEVPEYGPLYLWLESTGGTVQIGSTAKSRATALCVEIADDSNTVPTGRTCSTDGSAGHAVQRITARFNDVPRSHDGESEFTVRLAFVKDVGISPGSLRRDALAATGGAVTRVQRVDDRSDLFEITAEPDSDEDVTITLSSSGDCGEAGSICSQEEDPRKLYNSPTATVAGPILTASFQGLPSQHDGETAFSFRIAFSHEIATDEAEFRDHSVEVWGGEVTRAGPVNQRRDLWEVEVEPASDDSVMVSLKPTSSCAATGAVCTAGGRLLSVIPATMVPGPATWPVQITGEAQVGKTLTSDSSNLSERYGVQVTSMTYRWLANGARIPGANGRTYKPDDDKQGKRISVMATYTDDRGNEDTVTSGPTEPLAARDRIRRATGLALISGRALVGHTLTADKSLIIDANGLENAVFYYFWEADDESIRGATGTTYTPVEADAGKEITVIVAYVDDSGRGQNMTSPATLPVMTEEAAAAVEFRRSIRAAANADGSLTLRWNAPDDEVTGYRILRHRHSLGEHDPLVYVADTGSTATTYTDTDVVAGAPHSYRVQAIRNAALGERTISIRIFPVQKATNNPATGAPAISGTAQVGETLTADISGIADEDGLENVTKNYLWAAINSSGTIGSRYAYQWLADGAEIEDATGYSYTTYTLTEDDAGKTINVRVTFVDDAGYQETLTSAATDAVAPLPQPNSPARGAPTIGGTAQVGETLTVDTSGITDEDGLDDSTFTHQWVREDSVMVASAAGSYTPTDGDRGKSVKVRVSFTDDAGNPETRTSAQTAAVEARSNSPATGAPVISGTAHVGETLTANTSGITDMDGLTNVVYSYQWVRNDGTTDSTITGATGSTYPLVADDQGKAIKLRVRFTDDGGNEETLTSAPTAPVWGDGLPGAPRNLTVTAGDKEVTLSWEPPADNGNPPATRYRIEWRVEGKDYDRNAWGTAQETTYTTNDQANLANGVKYFFRVKAENGSGSGYGPYGPSSGGGERHSYVRFGGGPGYAGAVGVGEPASSAWCRLDWEDIEDAGWYVVQYYHLEDGEWLDLPAEGVGVAFHGSSAVVSNLHGLSWLRVRAMPAVTGESEWSQIEQLFGTNASDWEGVPVPEVEEGERDRTVPRGPGYAGAVGVGDTCITAW